MADSRRSQRPGPAPAALPETAPRADVAPAIPRRRASSPWRLGGAGLLIAVVAIIGGIALNNGQGQSCPSNLLACGSVGPDFTLPQVPSMRPLRLSSFRGHPVLLEMFATWCSHCQAEARVLESLDAANRKRGLVILSVVASPNDHNSEGNPHPNPTSPDDVRWFIATFHVQHPVIYDPGIARRQAAIYPTGGFPTIYLIDRNGIVRWSGVGARPLSDLQTQVDTVL